MSAYTIVYILLSMLITKYNVKKLKVLFLKLRTQYLPLTVYMALDDLQIDSQFIFCDEFGIWVTKLFIFEKGAMPNLFWEKR